MYEFDDRAKAVDIRAYTVADGEINAPEIWCRFRNSVKRAPHQLPNSLRSRQSTILRAPHIKLGELARRELQPDLRPAGAGTPYFPGTSFFGHYTYLVPGTSKDKFSRDKPLPVAAVGLDSRCPPWTSINRPKTQAPKNPRSRLRGAERSGPKQLSEPFGT